MIGLGSIPGAERDIVRVRKHARLSAVGWASTGFSWARFRQGYSLVGESPDVHGQLSRVRVPLPRYGSLARWMECPVTSREVVGSSPTRPTEHGIVPHRYRKPLVWRMLRCGRVLSACARAGGRAIVFP